MRRVDFRRLAALQALEPCAQRSHHLLHSKDPEQIPDYSVSLPRIYPSWFLVSGLTIQEMPTVHR